jgi:excinuclease UvrABC nuclease subunit
MPFPKQQGRSFTKAGIEALLPSYRGVYGIYRANAWIYVGKSDDMRKRLLEHLGGDNPRITVEMPTGFVTWVTDDDIRIEKALIVELDPIANRQVG